MVVLELHSASDWIFGVIDVDTGFGKRDWFQAKLFMKSPPGGWSDGLSRCRVTAAGVGPQ
jgi:hypothetical protein